MSFFKKADKKLNLFYNNEFIQQDIKAAKEISEIYFDKNFKKDSNDPYKFYLEGIFLGLSDRTAVHPYLVKTVAPDKVGFWDKLKGFQGHKIDYSEDPNFNLDNYFNLNWFDQILDSYQNHKNDIFKSKELYISNKINFFDFFVKRLSVYDDIQHTQHMRHYEGIERSKYVDLLKEEFRLILR
ncbi:hypothetical protein [Candidatus Pelagibacter sp.]|uniref:hypothetical protein n=1 Tax=Candidatus Pelagibacter sp. TaxID=2024849 RepID=UPI003F82BC46